MTTDTPTTTETDVFITWDEKTTTSRGAETARGTIATRAQSNDSVYHVTATRYEGKALAKVGVKLGNRRLVTDHLVPSEPAKLNGALLQLVRQIESADRADGEFAVIEPDTDGDGVAEIHDAHGEHVADVEVDEADDAVGVILPPDLLDEE